MLVRRFNKKHGVRFLPHAREVKKMNSLIREVNTSPREVKKNTAFEVKI